MYILCFVIAFSMVSAERGVINGSVQLPCRTEDTSYKIDWRRFNGRTNIFVVYADRITSRYRNRTYLTTVNEYRNLTITNLTFADAGRYTCTNIHGLSHVYTSIELSIIDSNTVNRTLNITLNDHVNLLCPFNSSKEWFIVQNNEFIPAYNQTSIGNNSIYFCFEGNSIYGIKIIIHDIVQTPPMHSIAIKSMHIYIAIVVALAVLA